MVFHEIRLNALFVLPSVVFLQHMLRAIAIQPGFGRGIVFQERIPERGAQRENDAVMIRILLRAFSR